jgi:two-component SAPR family response regulator
VAKNFKELYGENIRIICQDKLEFYHWDSVKLIWMKAKKNDLFRYLYDQMIPVVDLMRPSLRMRMNSRR